MQGLLNSQISNTVMNTDLTFITNEKDKNLLARFKVLIKDTKFFDALVGYFYTSGFHALYKSLEKTEIIDQILSITKNDDYLRNPQKQAQVKEYERQIDRMVYELYNLTDEEIAIVEGRRD